VALDPRTRRMRRFALADAIDKQVYAGPVAHDGVLYAASDASVLKFDLGAAGGAITEWAIAGRRAAASPADVRWAGGVVLGDAVYFTPFTDTGILELDTRSDAMRTYDLSPLPQVNSNPDHKPNPNPNPIPNPIPKAFHHYGLFGIPAAQGARLYACPFNAGVMLVLDVAHVPKGTKIYDGPPAQVWPPKGQFDPQPHWFPAQPPESSEPATPELRPEPPDAEAEPLRRRPRWRSGASPEGEATLTKTMVFVVVIGALAAVAFVYHETRGWARGYEGLP